LLEVDAFGWRAFESSPPVAAARQDAYAGIGIFRGYLTQSSFSRTVARGAVS
jgi:hypothetical protein